jgi:REP element-mobilizing transposase RayT
MNDLPVRKNIRLEDYDYSQNGAYFITVCAFEKRKLFGRISVGAIHESPAVSLSPVGNIVMSVIQEIPLRYPSVTLDKYIVMPNHIHMLITIHERAIRESPLQEEKRSLISQIVGYLKMNATKQIRIQNTKIYNVWQRGFYDRIIRNEKDYLEIWRYIDENPIEWEKDEYYI